MRLVNFCLFLVLVLASCKTQFQPLSIRNAENLKITKISLRGIEGEISISIVNPNSVGFNLYPSHVDAYFSGIKLGRAETNSKTFIPANSDAVHTFRITGNFRGISLASLANLSMGRLGELEIKGKLKAGKWFFKKRFAVSHTQKISFGK
jgi:LEA14-like dessication related protein